MILRQIKLTNFGLYSGDYTFDLAPLPTERFNRPLVLFRGKNGVGKSTLVLALRLCLHGALAFDQRVAQQEYDTHLLRLIHRRPDGGDQPMTASVEVQLDTVQVGKKRSLLVRRTWTRQGNRAGKTLDVWEDGVPLADLTIEQKDTLLRELIPPGILALFFFDGEKIQTLAEAGEQSQLLLADTVRGLLGLDTIDQLGRDLDLYITRQRAHSQVSEWRGELETLMSEDEALTHQLAEVQQALTAAEGHLTAVRHQIARQDQQIATAGGQYAQEREMRLAQVQALETEIDLLRRQAMELCSGLLPFAIAPKMLRAVSARLTHEKEIIQEQIAQEALERRLSRLASRLDSDDFWAGFRNQLDDQLQQQLRAHLSNELQSAATSGVHNAEPLILPVSEKERTTLQGWIDSALHETPQQFSILIATLNARQAELARLQSTLAQTPTLESIQPLLTALTQLHQQLGSQERAVKDLQAKRQQIEQRKVQIGQQRQRLHQQITEQEDESSRTFLATRTQQVLEEYRRQVTGRKIQQLELLLAQRFNQLCRKKGFLERVGIDAQSFAVTLYRLGKPFSRQQLSAGENQLFAMATLWALRELSGRPLPVIVDTPLSRLDSEHRASLIQEFFPFVSQQTLLLGTDVELDHELSSYLQPALSHIYELQFDAQAEKTLVAHSSPPAEAGPALLIEQLALL
jgi:DNA sulfur modification protein DndD